MKILNKFKYTLSSFSKEILTAKRNCFKADEIIFQSTPNSSITG